MKSNIIYTIIAIFLVVLVGAGLLNARKNNNLSQKLKSEEMVKVTQGTKPEMTTDSPKNMEPMDETKFLIDLEKSVIDWEAKKTLVSTNDHYGKVPFQEGFFYLKDNQITKGEIIADMRSLSSDDLTGALKNQLEKHLKSDDFFATEKFPTAKFSITEVTFLEKTQFLVLGNLTIKGITNQIEFPATIISSESRVSIKADFEIDRTRWDVRFGSDKFFDNLGNNRIDDMIKLSIEVSSSKE